MFKLGVILSHFGAQICAKLYNMRKNGSRLISIKQYRTTDLFVFALILAAAEILSALAARWFPSQAIYTFSLMVPIALTVMMRWGWPSVFYAAAGGLVVCLLSAGTAQVIHYACYIIGNAVISLMLIPAYLIGRDKIRSKWWSSALFALGGWLCVYLGRSFVWAIAFAISPMSGNYIWSGFVDFASGDLLSLAVAIIVVLVLRRLDGMFEDQVMYLKRVDKERQDRMRIDQFGENLGEIDEETFKILNKDNDLF